MSEASAPNQSKTDRYEFAGDVRTRIVFTRAFDVDRVLAHPFGEDAIYLCEPHRTGPDNFRKIRRGMICASVVERFGVVEVRGSSALAANSFRCTEHGLADFDLLCCAKCGHRTIDALLLREGRPCPRCTAKMPRAGSPAAECEAHHTWGECELCSVEESAWKKRKPTAPLIQQISPAEVPHIATMTPSPEGGRTLRDAVDSAIPTAPLFPDLDASEREELNRRRSIVSTVART